MLFLFSIALEDLELFGLRNGATAQQIHLATMEGDIPMVIELLDAGVEIDSIDENGRTPLLYAAEHGNLQLVDILIEKGANVEASWKGWTPLSASASNGHLETVQSLLTHGVQINLQGLNDSTIENYVIPLYVASQHGHTEVVQLLLNNGAVARVTLETGHTPLHTAAFRGHPKIVEVLIRAGAEIDGKIVSGKDLGMTPLHYASIQGSPRSISALLNAGADIDNGESEGLTALHLATAFGNYEAMELLLSEGATVDDSENSTKHTPLHLAVLIDDLEATKILIASGADPNLRIPREFGEIAVGKLVLSAPKVLRLTNGEDITNNEQEARNQQTLLYRAADNRRKQPDSMDMVLSLLEGGANTEARLINNATLMHIAVDVFEDTELLRAILKWGGNVNSIDVSGSTPLHYAAFLGSNDSLLLLLEAGADPDMINQIGLTPLQYSFCNDNKITNDLLIEYGASPHQESDMTDFAKEVCQEIHEAIPTGN